MINGTPQRTTKKCPFEDTGGCVRLLEHDNALLRSFEECHGIGYGSQIIELTHQDLDALRTGKVLAISNGEYVTFVYVGIES